MATIRDVAKEAGVSLGTVSRYLNGYTLKKTNMDKIAAAIKKLGFKQNYLAKGLKTKKSHAIGVVVNALTDIFAASIVTSLEDFLEKNNYELIIADYKNNIKLLNEKLKFLYSRNVDGIVLFHVEQAVPILKEFRKKKIPVVAVDTPISGFECDTVLLDNYHASVEAVKSLYEIGHRQIGIISGGQQGYVGSERLRGYVAAMKKYGIFDRELIVGGSSFKDSSYDATLDLLKNNHQITALYSTNYYMTIGAIQAINELNLRIPADISFIGFDDYDISTVIKPQLTVVAQPVAKIGREIGKIIIQKITNPADLNYQTKLFKAKIVWRDSVLNKNF